MGVGRMPVCFAGRPNQDVSCLVGQLHLVSLCYATQMSPRPLRRASGSGTCGLRKESALLGKADPLTLRCSCLVARLAGAGRLIWQRICAGCVGEVVFGAMGAIHASARFWCVARSLAESL